MKKVLFFICLLYPIFGYAQPPMPLAHDEAKTLNLAKGVDIDIPKGFHAIKNSIYWHPPVRGNYYLEGKIMEECFATADSTCLIAHPEVTSTISKQGKGKKYFMDVFNSTYKSSMVVTADENLKRHGINKVQSDSIGFDVLVDQYSNLATSPVSNKFLMNAIKNNAEKITLLVGDDAKNIMNADTIAYTSLSTPMPYDFFWNRKPQYAYCTYIMASKKGYPAIEILIYMNEKGKEHEADYIKTALESERFVEGWKGFYVPPYKEYGLGRGISDDLIGTWVYEDAAIRFELWIAGEATYNNLSRSLVGCYRLTVDGELISDFAFTKDSIPDKVDSSFPKGYCVFINGAEMLYHDAVTGLGDYRGFSLEYDLKDPTTMTLELGNEFLSFRRSYQCSRQLTKWPQGPRNKWKKSVRELWEKYNVYKPKGSTLPYFMTLKKIK